MGHNIRTHNLGYPRVGARRELKLACEAFWKGTLSEAELEAAARRLRATHWKTQQAAGIDRIPSNDFTFYDHVLDTTVLFGAVPERFYCGGKEIDLKRYFQLARGAETTTQGDCCAHGGAAALEMTKWFDTNYHYLVPEFTAKTEFRIAAVAKPIAEFQEALALGIPTQPVLLGPITFLALGKGTDGIDPLTLLDRLLPVYAELLRRLAAVGATSVQIDEPLFALDLTPAQQAAFRATYARLAAEAPQVSILLATYFGDLRENRPLFLSLPVAGFHVDAVRGGIEIPALLKEFPKGKELSLGIVDGRNIWRTDFTPALDLITQAVTAVGADHLLISPSCSLLHVPVSLAAETQLDPELKSWLAFADEKLTEVRVLADAASGSSASAPGASARQAQQAVAENKAAWQSRRSSARIHRPEVAARCKAIKPDDLERRSPFPIRQKKQRDHLKLPLFPTTTIGSFPQTAEVRSARARWKKGELSEADYDAFLAKEIDKAIALQEKIGIDVLVHGEFERNDMVEYFGEQLEGYAFTQNGWVQSYGSRCVKPPILFGDVLRPKPMTVRWSEYARSKAKKPMKGMLTGPITVLQWSFVRDDQPRRLTATQLALALRDEVCDLEKAGLAAIQIDEPALREGLPLRRADWADYLGWSVDLFRLTAAGVRDETQIHTHMCYCEFNDIIDSIARLDADVISIEASRSNMEILAAFANFKYPNEVGPGVWDIHSPRVPSADEMEALLRRAVAVLPRENIWVNPDCGLKTRAWAETIPALENLVTAAHRLRAVT